MREDPEARLLDRASYETFEPPSIPPTIRDPWLATSALQKSIRRGQLSDALIATALLIDVAPERLWRRLVVIAMEDVGVTDLVLVGEVLWVSGKRVWREQRGGNWRFASCLVSALCESVKCRDACDLLVVADWHESLLDHRTKWAQAPLGQLAEILAESRTSLAEQALAAWFIAGTATYPALNIAYRRGRYLDLFAVYQTLGVPEEVIQVCRWGATRTREAHALTLPLIWLTLKESPRSHVQEEGNPPWSYCGDLPVAAFDMHTRPGKLALARFARTCPPFREFLLRYVPEAELYDLACALVFRAEGGRVDRRLCYEGSDRLLKMADEAQVAWSSLPATAIREALAVTRQNLPYLNEVRRDVMRTIGD